MSAALPLDADPYDFVFTCDGQPIARMVDELARWAQHPLDQGWKSFTFVPKPKAPTPLVTARSSVEKVTPGIVFRCEWLTRHPDRARRPMVAFINDADLARYLEHFPEAAIGVHLHSK